MKKSTFLLLALIVFAGYNSVQAQCTGSELNPSPGVEYTYSTLISGAGYDGSGEYDWYVTQNVDLLAAGSIITLPSPYFTVNPATPYHSPSGVDNIQITWTPAATGLTFYLVLRYRETNETASPTCSAENIRAWQVVPLNSFLLAMVGGDAGGVDEACAADVTGAVVTPATPSLLLTYGNNTLYYVGTASGILGEWRPSLRVPALAATQTYVSVMWTADMTGTGGWVDMGVALTGATQDLVSPSNATVTDIIGTPILIRVVIANNNWQTLADQAITVALDGYLPTDYTVSDIINEGSTPCDPAPVFYREGIFTVKARPEPTGTPGFMVLTNP